MCTSMYDEAVCGKSCIELRRVYSCAQLFKKVLSMKLTYVCCNFIL